MSVRRVPLVLALWFVIGLVVSAPVRADGGVARPDERGDAGVAPDILGVSASIDGADLVLAVDFADTPPLDWSRDGDWTDTLVVFVSAGAEPDADGFALSVWASDGPEGAVFASMTNGGLSAAEPGAVLARIEGPTVFFRVAMDRVPEASMLQVRVVATRYGGEGGVDSLPDDGGWVSLSLSGLRGTSALPGVARFIAMLVAATLFSAGPLIWVHLRSRRMARLDNPEVQWP